MVHPIAGHKIKLDHKSFAGARCDLHVFPPGGFQLFPCSRPQLGGAVGHTLAQQVGARNNMAEQDSLQSFLICKEFVQRIYWNLVKCRVCWGEDSERSLAGQCVQEVGSLKGRVEGGEVGVFTDQGCKGLPLGHNWLLGRGCGDGVDVWSLLRLVLHMWDMLGRPHWEVVLQVANWARVVGETELLRQEWVAFEWVVVYRGTASQRLPL